MCIISFEKALSLEVNSYPGLYTGKTLEDVKLKVLDHWLNYIGNGLNKEDFIERFTYNKKYEDLYKDIEEKYYNGTPLFTAYTEIMEVTRLLSTPFEIVNPNSALNGAFTKEELKSIEHIKSIPIGLHDFQPYPNFEKKYSAIWNFSEIFDRDWLLIIKWFYEKCLEHLSSDKIYSDFQAIPKDFDDPKWVRRIDEQEMFFDFTFKKYRQGDESFGDCITREYECEFTGDTKDFIIRRFHIENERRKNFCKETIEHINTMIESKQVQYNETN